MVPKFDFFKRKVTLTIKLAKIRVESQLTGLTPIFQHGSTDHIFGNKVKIPFACESQMTEVTVIKYLFIKLYKITLGFGE